MKPLKNASFLYLAVIMLLSLTHCKCPQKAIIAEEPKQTIQMEQADNSLEKEHLELTQGKGKPMPLFIRDTYFKKSASGKKETGINIYFPTLINKSNYKLEKVYFRGMIGDMQSGKASYFANLKPNTIGLIMSQEENAEFGNKIPEPFPFQLKSNECMLSYIDNGETKYFQVYNIVEKK
jgi:hypothetical protein